MNERKHCDDGNKMIVLIANVAIGAKSTSVFYRVEKRQLRERDERERAKNGSSLCTADFP